MKKLVNSVIVTALLSFVGWAGLSLVSHGERVAALEANQQTLTEWLGRVEEKLDRVLERSQ